MKSHCGVSQIRCSLTNKPSLEISNLLLKAEFWLTWIWVVSGDSSLLIDQYAEESCSQYVVGMIIIANAVIKMSTNLWWSLFLIYSEEVDCEELHVFPGWVLSDNCIGHRPVRANLIIVMLLLVHLWTWPLRLVQMQQGPQEQRGSPNHRSKFDEIAQRLSFLLNVVCKSGDRLTIIHSFPLASLIYFLLGSIQSAQVVMNCLSTNISWKAKTRGAPHP